MARPIIYPFTPGQRFGRLVVLEQVYGTRPRPRTDTPMSVRYWVCRCDCGTVATVLPGELVSSKRFSCGCSAREYLSASHTTHGKARTPEYKVWSGMKERCYRKKHHAYCRYGGRGIKVCQRWQASFPDWQADMGPRPSPEHSIDRIDNDAGYYCGHCEECLANDWPSNCRWATWKEQGQNRSLKTHCKHGHPLAPGNLLISQKGKRRCKICTRAYNTAYNKTRSTEATGRRHRAKPRPVAAQGAF